MSRVQRSLRVAPLALIVAILAGGCASTANVPEAQVSAAVASSNTAVRQAEQAGGQDYAPLEMRRARSKLEQSQQASEGGETLKAKRLAEQAQVDAELAQAKARSGKAQEAVRELQESIRTLREEIERNQRQ